jgi:hypothetical protein
VTAQALIVTPYIGMEVSIMDPHTDNYPGIVTATRGQHGAVDVAYFDAMDGLKYAEGVLPETPGVTPAAGFGWVWHPRAGSPEYVNAYTWDPDDRANVLARVPRDGDAVIYQSTDRQERLAIALGYEGSGCLDLMYFDPDFELCHLVSGVEYSTLAAGGARWCWPRQCSAKLSTTTWDLTDEESAGPLQRLIDFPSPGTVVLFERQGQIVPAMVASYREGELGGHVDLLLPWWPGPRRAHYLLDVAYAEHGDGWRHVEHPQRAWVVAA